MGVCPTHSLIDVAIALGVTFFKDLVLSIGTIRVFKSWVLVWMEVVRLEEGVL